jgi:Protein of unknown function (DUF992)
MRWWFPVLLPVCMGFGTLPASTAIVEIGVLTCTLGHAIDTPTAPQSPAPSEGREMVCSFKAANNAPEETYVGVVKAVGGVGTLPDKAAMLWSVRVPTGTQPVPGLLEQSYAADGQAPAGQTPPLVGGRNGEISLHTMADKQAGSASKEKQVPPQFVVAAIELVLKVSAA